MNINISDSEKYYIRIFSLCIGILVVLLGIFASISYGAADIPIAKIFTAFTNYDDSTEHIIIRSMRLPRTLIASMVGASLAIAGALMQGLTQNPLAAPGILGINAGAALAVVTVVFGLGTSSAPLITLVAFVGALVAALAVYSLGSLGHEGATPLNLTIAGAALTALLSSITTGVLILSDRTLEEVRFWLAGSLAGRDFNLFLTALPWMVVGLLTAFALSRQINVLSLGESVATGLGQQTSWIKLATASSVVILAGSAVALAGPIGFVGLVIPHLARGVMGVDYRWVLPGAAVFGAGLLVWADLAARWVIRPQELPVGVMTALLGAPFLLYLVRWRVKRG
ncbi:iron ABC transporter permease [Nostocaceae cyanobacterium CENA369]|uniref:Iron ABC transporter permease n=1 Tax=Dendronalium phyllosphericum CENA369 TaxID=1725256 RepID=A0A8J7I5Y5_9NOST|nr:iron ABC transporter permease [Dendronalium phyllosphericum]MBH8576571.1 iron ABC transporter permease [Dendronalium phyllosphericum CENA369]